MCVCLCECARERERESELEHRVKTVRDGLAGFQGLLCSLRAEVGIFTNVYMCFCIYHTFMCVCVCLYTSHNRMERVSTSAMTSR